MQTGLATMTAPVGTLISYATAPGKVAGDGSKDHGVFTAHLLREMRVPGTPIELVFKKVRQAVVAETAGQQVPWEATSLQGDFVFANKTEATPPKTTTPKPVPQGAMVQIRGQGSIPDFWLDVTEVTVSAYQACVASGACTQSGTGPYCNTSQAHRRNHPLNCVSFQDAKSYCSFQRKRLPSEREWFLAFTGFERRSFPWGQAVPTTQLCWKRTDLQGTCPVGSQADGSSPEGVLDLAGNVWEWVLNTCEAGKVEPPDGCFGLTEFAIARGGSWVDQKPEAVGVAARESNLGLQKRWGTVGFRCARDASLPLGTAGTKDQASDKVSDKRKLPSTPFRPNLVKLSGSSALEASSPGTLFVAETETTQGQYRSLMNVNPSEQFMDGEGTSRPCRNRGVGDELPVFCVSFIEALRYANALSRVEGLNPCYEEQGSAIWVVHASCSGYRIPSSAEWERAALGPSPTRYVGGDSLNEVAWWKGNSHGKVHPVRTKRPNAAGLYDMSGNVYEWTVDPADGKRGPELTTGNRLVRGGSFFVGEPDQRLTARSTFPVFGFSTGIGFRIVRSVP